VTRLLYLPAVLAVATGVAEAGAGRPVIARLEGPASGVIRNDSLHAAIGANTFTLEVSGVTAGTPLTLRLVGPEGRVINAPIKPLAAAPQESHGHSAASTGDDHTEEAGKETAAPAASNAGKAGSATVPADDHTDATPHAEESDDHEEADGHASAAVDDHDAEASDEHPSGTLEFHGAVDTGDHVASTDDDHAAGVVDDHGAASDDHSDAASDEHASPLAEDLATPVDSHDEAESAVPASEHTESSGGHSSEADEHEPAATFAGWTKVNLTSGNWKAELLSGDEVKSVARFAVTYGGPSPYYLTVTGGLIVGFLLLGVTNRVLLARQVSR
jgi:hypothetical protein